MMSSEFAIILSKNRQFGWMLKPYLIEKRNSEYYTIAESILAENSSLERYTDAQKELIKLLSQCSDKEICKLFSKKKVSIREFLSNLTDQITISSIREYIEKRLLKSFDIIRHSQIEIFYNSDSKNLFKEDRLELVKGTAQAVFNFIREENGSKYYLSISDGISDIKLSDKSGDIITNSPCILMSDQRLFFFSKGDEGIDGKKLLPFFTKDSILIPKSAEKKYFETFVKNSIENYEVRSKGFSIENVDIKPIPVLSFESDWQNEFSILLKFKYNSILISSNYSKRAFIDFSSEDDHFTFRKMSRDIDFEHGIREFLLTFKELQENNYGNFKIRKEYLNEISLISWLNINSIVLSEKGISIVQNFYNKKYFTKEISINFRLKENKDWFDLLGMVKFGEYEIPFINLRSNILNNNREFILPNGEIAILPEEWFTKYSDLIKLSERVGDLLKINKHHLNYFYDELATIDQSMIKKAMEITQVKTEKPAGLRAEFRPYQETGFNWIYSLYKNNFGCCLADDMGLGKTLQTLAVILKIKDDKQSIIKQKQIAKSNGQLSLFEQKSENIKDSSEKNESAGLIVMPTSLIHNWVNEINKFSPNLRYYVYTGVKRIKSTQDFNDFDLIITSYGVLRNDIDILKNYLYQFLILDESQYIKNPGSRINQSVGEIETGFKMVLTGTPIENSLIDLWSQLNFINPGLLGGQEFFRKEFADAIERESDDETRMVKQLRLQKLINPFILRRTKQEVLKDLPELTETIKYCCMSEEQRSLYETEKSRIRNSLIDLIESGEQSQSNIIVIQGLTLLRQLANHPKMIEESNDSNSGKFDDIIMMIESVLAENHKVLMFSSFVKHLEIFAEYFDRNNIEYSKLIGSTHDRESEIKGFQENPERKIFLISLKAGGVGLNLTSADYVFFLDPWWNPAAENQALSRAHRIGQKNKVMVYRFITEDSIEEKIIKLQERKKNLADAFINSNNPFKQLTKDDLIDLFN